MKDNQKFWAYFVSAIVLTLIFSETARAHVAVGETVGFWHGISHPIGGLDHILAMIAVGLWSARLGGRAIWLVPLAFVSMMIFGGFLGMANVSVPFVEQCIIISDFILGFLILLAARFSLPLSAAIVGLLAVFHGLAHGMEMPEIASGVAYGAGFTISTCLLHLLGIAVGFTIDLNSLHREKLFRASGIALIIGAFYVLSGG
jgi:urease accessory protein